MSVIQSIMDFIKGNEKAETVPPVQEVAQEVRAPHTPPQREGYMPDTPDAVRKAYADQMRSRSLKRRILEAAKAQHEKGEMDDAKYTEHLDTYGTDKDHKKHEQSLLDKFVSRVGQQTPEQKDEAEERRKQREAAKETKWKAESLAEDNPRVKSAAEKADDAVAWKRKKLK